MTTHEQLTILAVLVAGFTWVVVFAVSLVFFAMVTPRDKA